LTVFKHNHWLHVAPVLPRISLSRDRGDWSSERDSTIALPTARTQTPRGAGAQTAQPSGSAERLLVGICLTVSGSGPLVGIKRQCGPFADSNVASHNVMRRYNAGITPGTLRKKHAGPVSVRFKYTIKRSIYRPALPSRTVDIPLRMKPTFSASARALTYPTDFSRVRRVVAMDPASILRHGQFVTAVRDAVHAQRGFFFPSPVPARYGRIFHRHAHVPWRFL